MRTINEIIAKAPAGLCPTPGCWLPVNNALMCCMVCAGPFMNWLKRAYLVPTIPQTTLNKTSTTAVYPNA